MIIGFIGDVHGMASHAIAVAAMWQAVNRKRFDLLIQLGDMGAFPDESQRDAATRSYAALDPSQADFMRLLEAKGERARLLHRVREMFAGPIYFLRSNHEDFEYLNRLPLDDTGGATVGPFDLFRYVPDGNVLRFGEVRVAFLGGIETQVPDARTIDGQAYTALAGMGPGAFDILVTHDVPHCIRVNWQGKIGGSRMITERIQHSQPSYHLSSHVHHLNGPRNYGRTTSLRIDGLVASAKWGPNDRNLRPGCIAILDTETAQLEPVMDQWLSRYNMRNLRPRHVVRELFRRISGPSG